MHTYIEQSILHKAVLIKAMMMFYSSLETKMYNIHKYKFNVIKSQYGQSRKREQIFAYRISDKRHTWNMQFFQLSNFKNPISKQVKDMNRHFSKDT